MEPGLDELEAGEEELEDRVVTKPPAVEELRPGEVEALELPGVGEENGGGGGGP